ncbi:hypothetical protein QUA41_30620 [Microcoleus sp. Pol11C1]|uniref:hypothetical protein n=1 Tax=unclassified Microcoleus TaxID=2642155 RepID=UPI002FD004E0
MPDFFHPALKGEQIHEAKIKILVEGSAMPIPEWEGQFVAIGKKLYYSILQNNVLTWIQPVAYNAPQLPNNVVIFESGLENPPAPRNRSGIIYLNIDTKDIWYSDNNNWIKLGKDSGTAAGLDIGGDKGGVDNANYFSLQDPTNSLQDNCLRVKTWTPSAKYCFGIKTPSSTSLGGSIGDLFYVELWRGNNTVDVSSHLGSSQSLSILDTALFIPNAVSRIGVYLLANFTKSYVNFEFNLETRFIDVKGLASVYYF